MCYSRPSGFGYSPDAKQRAGIQLANPLEVPHWLLSNSNLSGDKESKKELGIIESRRGPSRALADRALGGWIHGCFATHEVHRIHSGYFLLGFRLLGYFVTLAVSGVMKYPAGAFGLLAELDTK